MPALFRGERVLVPPGDVFAEVYGLPCYGLTVGPFDLEMIRWFRSFYLYLYVFVSPIKLVLRLLRIVPVNVLYVPTLADIE